MFNKYPFLLSILFIVGCSSIPEVPVPNLPFISEDAEAENNITDTDDDDNDMSQLMGYEYESRGDGYLSLKYGDGHLETIKIKLGRDEIVLSRGQTVIKKLSVGRYSFDVNGEQKDTLQISDSLTYDGDTDEYIFNVSSPGSAVTVGAVKNRFLNHNFGSLVVGSRLINPVIEIRKLDQPLNIFNVCQEENDTKECAYTDKVSYASPVEMKLPEGNYLIKASGKSEEIYISKDSENTIEITSNGFNVSSK
tara:strand:- start:815 stop:1564 length:750 start_codon:yes stop_codon:yes gene_type:complete